MDEPQLPKSSQNFFNPAPDPGLIPPEERQMAMFTHLSALSVLFTGFGGIVGPLIVWQINKDKMPSLEPVAKEAINFNITVFIAYFVSAILTTVCIGFLLLPVVAVGSIILTVIAGMKANEGIFYRYPMTIRLFK